MCNLHKVSWESLALPTSLAQALVILLCLPLRLPPLITQHYSGSPLKDGQIIFHCMATLRALLAVHDGSLLSRSPSFLFLLPFLPFSHN
jgi:hypothetical protein